MEGTQHVQPLAVWPGCLDGGDAARLYRRYLHALERAGYPLPSGHEDRAAAVEAIADTYAVSDIGEALADRRLVAARAARWEYSTGAWPDDGYGLDAGD